MPFQPYPQELIDEFVTLAAADSIETAQSCALANRKFTVGAHQRVFRNLYVYREPSSPILESGGVIDSTSGLAVHDVYKAIDFFSNPDQQHLLVFPRKVTWCGNDIDVSAMTSLLGLLTNVETVQMVHVDVLGIKQFRGLPHVHHIIFVCCALFFDEVEGMVNGMDSVRTIKISGQTFVESSPKHWKTNILNFPLLSGISLDFNGMENAAALEVGRWFLGEHEVDRLAIQVMTCHDLIAFQEVVDASASTLQRVMFSTAGFMPVWRQAVDLSACKKLRVMEWTCTDFHFQSLLDTLTSTKSMEVRMIYIHLHIIRLHYSENDGEAKRYFGDLDRVIYGIARSGDLKLLTLHFTYEDIKTFIADGKGDMEFMRWVRSFMPCMRGLGQRRFVSTVVPRD
ncbi:uncharacterized protein ARMOST_06525 [Armillaria ostoyae]|uniref:F-box domain-containing protein n=1 Tax=Armillaria ostoyae TaxID=47428 RepID=A0A284R384_ARMOS|nr:uncharacterized protein ARMOST_06525 [Armillaria ostoyae]